MDLDSAFPTLSPTPAAVTPSCRAPLGKIPVSANPVPDASQATSLTDQAAGHSQFSAFVSPFSKSSLETNSQHLLELTDDTTVDTTPALSSSAGKKRQPSLEQNRQQSWKRSKFSKELPATASERERVGNLFHPVHPNWRKIFVGNIPHGSNQGQLTKLFNYIAREATKSPESKLSSEAGASSASSSTLTLDPVTEVVIVDDPKRNLAFAWITFRTVVQTTLAVSYCDSHEATLKSKVLKVKRPKDWKPTVYPLGQALPPIPEVKTVGEHTLFVGGIPLDATEAQVLAVLGEFGVVSRFKLHRHNWGESKGFAFVEFESSSAADAAIQRLNGWKLFEDRCLTVQYHKPKKVAPQKICPLYRKGRCMDSSCPDLHEGEVVPPTVLCHDWANTGSCTRGLNCNFAHDFKVVPCKFYLTRSCTAGTNCVYNHDIPCYSLILDGSCQTGPRCPFSHAALPLPQRQAI